MYPVTIYDCYDYEKTNPLLGTIHKEDGVIYITFINTLTKMTEQEFKTHGWIYTIDEKFIGCCHDCDVCVTPIC
jgi:hypothetical protein